MTMAFDKFCVNAVIGITVGDWAGRILGSLFQKQREVDRAKIRENVAKKRDVERAKIREKVAKKREEARQRIAAQWTEVGKSKEVVVTKE